MREFTKTFEKVPPVRRRHGSKAYTYGYVWLLLPPECIGKTALLKVYVLEEGERPPAQPATPQPAQPQPRPQPIAAQKPQALQPRPAQPRPQQAQPRPQLTQPRPPAQLPQSRPQAPLPSPRVLSEPLPPLQPSQPGPSPELEALLRQTRPQPERPLRDLLPFEEFMLEPEEKGEEEEKRRRRLLFGWP